MLIILLALIFVLLITSHVSGKSLPVTEGPIVYSLEAQNAFVSAVYVPTPPKPSLSEQVRATALKWGIEPSLFARIVSCESGFKPNAKNPASTASGILQFLDSTYARYAKLYGIKGEKDDPTNQLELAARIIVDGGISNWDASRSCWE